MAVLAVDELGQPNLVAQPAGGISCLQKEIRCLSGVRLVGPDTYTVKNFPLAREGLTAVERVAAMVLEATEFCRLNGQRIGLMTGGHVAPADTFTFQCILATYPVYHAD
jgi:hypothetical protein